MERRSRTPVIRAFVAVLLIVAALVAVEFSVGLGFRGSGATKDRAQTWAGDGKHAWVVSDEVRGERASGEQRKCMW